MAIWKIAFFILAITSAAQAEDDISLRWKFTPGDSQLYRMTQTARLDLSLDSGNIVTEVHRVFDFRWSVEAVAADGTASISVQVTRVGLHVVGPGGQETEYDSQSDQQSRGFAATLAPLFKTLVESELKAQINSRGELSQLQIPEDLQIVLSSRPVGKALGQLGSVDDFESLLRLGLPTLPESDSFALGQQWEEDRELENSPFGSPKAHNEYRWNSTRKIQEQQLAVIVPATSISLNKSAAGEEETLITGQESEGEILFNLTTGRLQSSQTEVRLELNSTDGGQPVNGTLVHTVAFEQLDEEAAR